MSLFEKLNNKRSSLHEVKDDGIKKPTKKANKEVFNVTGKSAARDAKKYASGEYPKIGGGSRIGSKSKGSGAETGAKVNLNTTSGSKSKGTTPVKVNITKPIKQSEVSKKSKVFSKKIEKNQIVKAIKKDADRLVRKAEKGDKKARKKIFKVLDKRFKKLSPADQEIQAKKMYDVQKKMGRTFNPKTGNFEGPDTEFQKSLSKIKDSKGKRITSGPVSVTAGPEIRKRVEKIRDTRATKAGMPDPFKSTTKFSQKQFNKTLKSRGVKVPQVPLIPDPFGKGDTKGQMNVKGLEAKAFKKTQPKDVKLPKSFTDFSKKLKKLKTDVAKTASATPRTVTKKYKPTTTVKQSEVSKQAKDFTKKVNQARTKKVTPTTTASKPKTTNVFKKVSKVTSGKKVTNSKGIGNKFRGAENKAAKDARIKADRASSGMGGGKQPPKNNKPLSSPAPEPNNNSGKIVKQSKFDKIKADIDARNPTKPGQYTGKPVPLKQREYTSFKNKNLSPKGKKFVEGLPKFIKNKNFAKIGKAALKNPYVAAGAAVVGTALAGYGAYRGIKGLLNKPKVASLKTTDLKPGRTVTYGRDDPKGKFKKGDDVRFDALGLGFTKKKGVEKKKPTFQDFQSGKYQYTSK